MERYARCWRHPRFPLRRHRGNRERRRPVLRHHSHASPHRTAPRTHFGRSCRHDPPGGRLVCSKRSPFGRSHSGYPEGEMSVVTKARRNLNFVDPAPFTSQFRWKNTRSGRNVFCEGLSLREIANRFGTPAYVYSKRAILDAHAKLERGLSGVLHTLCFAVKANGNLSILKLLAQRGCGFDIVSGGELDHLGRIAVPGNRIVFSGVGKSREEIRAALRYKVSNKSAPGILQFNIESAPELEILLEEASRSRSVPGVSVRINPDVKAGGHPHISTGLQQHKFGLNWREARGLYLAHRFRKQIRWQGISAHIGSQIVDLAPFQQALQRLAGYLLDLRQQGIALEYLDFGGGLGVRYTNERPSSRTAYARMVSRIVKPLG